QVARLRAVRASRDPRTVTERLAALRGAARGLVAAGTSGSATLVPSIVEAVRARASVGEISDALSAEWGTYRP
ncbi:MAG: methylmalonyl-CoA mutase, partial [Gemmatimonadaceae bacterium]|nr:methylmalonyl-CoA mutase [Gemmatimonadaceae bacterium]